MLRSVRHAGDDQERRNRHVQGRRDEPVYVTAVFNEAANYDGQSGPPPAGAPIGSYQKGGKAIPATPGPDAKIKMSFDDSVRWK